MSFWLRLVAATTHKTRLATTDNVAYNRDEINDDVKMMGSGINVIYYWKFTISDHTLF